MKRALITIGIGVIAIVMATVIPWRVAPQAPVPVAFADLGSAYPMATVRGTAHYNVVIEQNIPASLLSDAKRYWLYPLFPEHDTTSRAIVLWVRSPVQPEPGVSFEYLQLTGPVGPPNRQAVPSQTQYLLSQQSDYFFADELWVIEPTQQSSYEP